MHALFVSFLCCLCPSIRCHPWAVTACLLLWLGQGHLLGQVESTAHPSDPYPFGYGSYFVLEGGVVLDEEPSPMGTYTVYDTHGSELFSEAVSRSGMRPLFRLGAAAGGVRGLHLGIAAEWPISAVFNKTRGVLSAGWNLPLWDGRVLVRPTLSVAWQNSAISFGSFDTPASDTTFVAFGEDTLRAPSIDVSLNARQTLIRPELVLALRLTPGSMLQVGVGYDYTIRQEMGTLTYQGGDDSSTRPLDEAGSVLRFDNAPLREGLPAVYDGLVFSLSLLIGRGGKRW